MAKNRVKEEKGYTENSPSISIMYTEDIQDQSCLENSGGKERAKTPATLNNSLK